MQDKDNIASDRLRGVAQIAEFIGERERRTRYLIERGLIPVGKEGMLFVASKQRLLDDWRRKTGGEGASP